MEWHDDHWDDLHVYSPWRAFEDGESWATSFVQAHEHSIPSNMLYQDQAVTDFLRALSTLRPEEYPNLLGVEKPKPHAIPLFKDNTSGYEYQCQVSSDNLLTSILCPAVAMPQEEQSELVEMIEEREPWLVPSAVRRVPRYVIPLGTLQVRTTDRYPHLCHDPDPITETMDYYIMLDITVAAVSVWILTARIQLKEHDREEGADVPQLPIFRGLMGGSGWGYTAACILSSVHQLSDDPSKQPDFEKLMRVVDKTRSGSDPRTLRVTKEIEAKVLVNAYSEEAEKVVEALRASEEGRSHAGPGPMSGLHLDSPWREVPLELSARFGAPTSHLAGNQVVERTEALNYSSRQT